jgi:hypothetical protein
MKLTALSHFHPLPRLMQQLGIAATLSVTAIFGATNTALGDTLLIPLGEQAPEMQAVKRPDKGLSTEQVVQIFGRPVSQTPAVGNPPISRWTFDDFVVYFESDKVIHTVLKHRKKSPASTDPAPVEDTTGPGPALVPGSE